MSSNTKQSWWKVPQLAKAAGLSERHIRTLIDLGELEAYKLSPRILLVSTETWQNYLNQHKTCGEVAHV